MTFERPNDSNKCHPIMLAEVKYILEAHKERYKLNLRSNSAKVFHSTLAYADMFCRINEKSVTDDLRGSLSALSLNEEEIALIGSLFPGSVDDLKIFVPSVQRLDEGILKTVVDKVSGFAQ